MSDYKKLKAQLDRWFKKYIRMRDSHDGYGKCISCGKLIQVGPNWQAGHYINSTYLSLRWDEKNVHGQCKRCNHFLSGNLLEYRRGLIKKYGKEVLQYLEIKKFNKFKTSVFALKALIDIYKKKVKEYA